MKIVIETPGTNLSLDHGVLIVKTERNIQEISLLHITSIHIQTQARISTALIIECIKSHIPIYFENNLEVEAMLWTPYFGSISNIRKKQALFSYSDIKYKLIKKLILRKNSERINFIKKITTKSEILSGIKQLENINDNIEKAPAEDSILRSLEGNSSKLYFNLYNRLFPTQYQFKKRTYKKSTNLINVCLNYTYGILYNEITKALITAGLDPYLGFFHAAQYNKPSLTYDIIEPYRVWAEQSVLKTIRKKEFREIKEPVSKEGHLQKVAKHLLIEKFIGFLKENKIIWNKKTKTPLTHIQLDAYKIAQYILNLSDKTLIMNICKKNKK